MLPARSHRDFLDVLREFGAHLGSIGIQDDADVHHASLDERIVCLGASSAVVSVHSRYGLHARQVAYATLCTEGFSSFVASATASIATGWSEPVPGRVYPRCGPPPFHGAPG